MSYITGNQFLINTQNTSTQTDSKSNRDSILSTIASVLAVAVTSFSQMSEANWQRNKAIHDQTIYVSGQSIDQIIRTMRLRDSISKFLPFVIMGIALLIYLRRR